MGELKAKIEKMKKNGEDTTSQEVQLHKRYAIPFACIVFGLIGVPLGIQPRRSGRSHGFVFGILVILAYYMSLTGAEQFALKKSIPPLLAGWAPNLLFGCLGVYLLVKAAKEKPFKPVLLMNEALDLIQQKWRRFSEDV